MEVVRMATRDEWAFDLLGHVQEHYAEALQFVPDEEQRYPDRIVGSVYEGLTGGYSRAVILPKGVGPDNASRFRRYVTMPPAVWASITSRPAGWRYFVMMVGLLPDGQPWWSAMYEEATLAELRDQSENMGGFYRFDPGLTSKALIRDWDRDRPEGADPDSFVYTLTDAHETITTGDPVEFLEALRATAALASEGPDHGIVKIAPGQLTIDFDSILAADVSEGAKRPVKAG